MIVASRSLRVSDARETNWTPLRHWTQAELAAMAQRLSGRYESWGRDWMTRPDFWALSPIRVGTAPMVTPRLKNAQALLPLHQPDTVAGVGGPRAWIGFPLASNGSRGESIAELCMRMMFGDAAKGSKDGFGAGVGLAALAGLVARMQAIAGIDVEDVAIVDGALHAELPESAFHAWAGCVQVSLPGSGGVVIYLDGSAAANLLGAKQGAETSDRSGGLTPIQQAAGAASIGLGARLNSVELTFGQLKSLQVGDVVVLPHPVEDPLRVVTQSDALICKAYLGRSGKRRALQVVRCLPTEKRQLD